MAEITWLHFTSIHRIQTSLLLVYAHLNGNCLFETPTYSKYERMEWYSKKSFKLAFYVPLCIGLTGGLSVFFLSACAIECTDQEDETSRAEKMLSTSLGWHDCRSSELLCFASPVCRANPSSSAITTARVQFHSHQLTIQHSHWCQR